MLYGLLCKLGVEGGLVIGLTLAEVITDYWSHRNRTAHGGSHPSPQKVYFLNRRIHHGQIGTLLLLSLFFRGTSVPAAILTGIGIGLVKDDCADFKDWFRFKKGDESMNRESSKSDHDNDLYSGNQGDIGRLLHGESIDILTSNKSYLLSTIKKIGTMVESQFESIGDTKSSSIELLRQRRRTYYRFKRWENSTH
jgi:hypothetical protein